MSDVPSLLRLRWPLAGLLLAVMVSGCTLFPESAPRPRQHDLGPPPEVATEVLALTTKVRLGAVQAPPWLRAHAVHYRREDIDATGVHTYSRRQWVAPPPQLLAYRLEQQLAPVLAGPRQDARWQLDLRLERFEQVFVSETQADVVVRARATLVDLSASGQHWQQVFEIRRRAPGADGPGAVQGLAAVSDSLVEALVAWLVAVSDDQAD